MAEDREKYRRAVAFMKETFGVQPSVVGPFLKRLLKVYGNQWNHIEEENYRLLADNYFELQETQLQKGKDISTTAHQKCKETQGVVTRNMSRSFAVSREENVGNGCCSASDHVNTGSTSGLQLETLRYSESEPNREQMHIARVNVMEVNEKRDLESPLQATPKRQKMVALSTFSTVTSSMLMEPSIKEREKQEQTARLIQDRASGLSGRCQHCQHCQSSLSLPDDFPPSGIVNNEMVTKEGMLSENASVAPVSGANTGDQGTAAHILPSIAATRKKPKLEPVDTENTAVSPSTLAIIASRNALAHILPMPDDTVRNAKAEAGVPVISNREKTSTSAVCSSFRLDDQEQVAVPMSNSYDAMKSSNPEIEDPVIAHGQKLSTSTICCSSRLEEGKQMAIDALLDAAYISQGEGSELRCEGKKPVSDSPSYIRCGLQKKGMELREENKFDVAESTCRIKDAGETVLYQKDMELGSKKECSSPAVLGECVFSANEVQLRHERTSVTESHRNASGVAKCVQQLETNSLQAIAEAYSGVSDESSGNAVERNSVATHQQLVSEGMVEQERQMLSTVNDHSMVSALGTPAAECQVAFQVKVKEEFPEGPPSDIAVRASPAKCLPFIVKQEPETLCGDHCILTLQKTPSKMESRKEDTGKRVISSSVNSRHIEFLTSEAVRGLSMLKYQPHARQGAQEICRHDFADISRGEEKVVISVDVESPIDNLPNTFYYISKSIIYQNAYVNFSLARIGDENCCANCVDDCLKAALPCACARETGGEYAYTIDGCLRGSLLNEALDDKLNYDTVSKRMWYCQSGYTCPLERAKNESSPGSCKGHLMRKFVKECWSKCGCSLRCGNRVVQRGISYKLQVFLTPEGKGWGVRTLEALPEGAFVCEYVGEILTNIELDTRNHLTKGEVMHYPVLLDADWSAENVLKDEEALCLDATFYGNVARFINHRCHDANVVEIPVEIESPDHHYYHVAFFTVRSVAVHEEITWDYCIDFDDHDHPIKAFRCRCGSKFCRDREEKPK